MNQPIIETLQSVLVGKIVGPEQIRNGLLACLDLAPADDADANELRFVLEKMDMPAALNEFKLAISEIQNRRPGR
jgi:hypothetical protein